MSSRLFKAKKKEEGRQVKESVENGIQFWDRITKLYEKDKGIKVDKDDPEYNAQKIYQHWLKMYL